MTAPVLLLAASGLARETLAVLRRLGRPVAGILDDEPGLHGTRVGEVPVLGPLEAVTDHPDTELVLCAGKGRSRMIMAERLAGLGVDEHRFATVVAPDVTLPPGCTVGPGSIVLSGTVLTADVGVGRHVVIMPRVVLTHDDRVEDFATLCAGVTLGGHVQVGRGAYLGMSSSVREHSRIGDHAVLGMGAVLLGDLPAGRTWAGVPAHDLGDGRAAAIPAIQERVS